MKECITTQEEDLELVASSHFRHLTTVCNSSSEGSDAPKSPVLMCARAQTHRHTGIYIILKNLGKSEVHRNKRNDPRVYAQCQNFISLGHLCVQASLYSFLLLKTCSVSLCMGALPERMSACESVRDCFLTLHF